MDLSPPGGVDGFEGGDRFLACLSLEALPRVFLVVLSGVLATLEELEASNLPSPPRDGIENHLIEQGYGSLRGSSGTGDARDEREQKLKNGHMMEERQWGGQVGICIYKTGAKTFGSGV
jgi:hypothetical protein